MPVVVLHDLERDGGEGVVDFLQEDVAAAFVCKAVADVSVTQLFGIQLRPILGEPHEVDTVHAQQGKKQGKDARRKMDLGVVEDQDIAGHEGTDLMQK